MPIQGITDRFQLKRAGKLKIGQKTADGRPEKLDYFRIDTEDARLIEAYHELWGEKPTRVPIVFFRDNVEDTFPHWRKARRKSGVWCQGDGLTAVRKTEKPEQMKDNLGSQGFEVPCTDECPYRAYKGQPEAERNQRFCKPEGLLRFLIYELPTVNYFEVKVAQTSIPWINSKLEVLRGLTVDHRITGIPLLLKVVPFEAVIGGKKMTVYGLDLDITVSPKQLSEADSGDALLLGPGHPEAQAAHVVEADYTEAPDDHDEEHEGDEAGGEEPADAPDHQGVGSQQEERNPNYDEGQRKYLQAALKDPIWGKEQPGLIMAAKQVKSKEAAATFVEHIAREIKKRQERAKQGEKAAGPALDSGSESEGSLGRSGGPTTSQLDEATVLVENDAFGTPEEKDVWYDRVASAENEVEAEKALQSLRDELEKFEKK